MAQVSSVDDQTRKFFCTGLVHIEQVKDYLQSLIKQNNSRVKMMQRSGVEYAIVCILSLKGAAADYIMHLCDYWNYSVDVKFAAIEIYDQFIATLLNEIYKTIFIKTKALPYQHKSKYKVSKKYNRKNNDNQMNLNNQWNETLHHINGQMELRAVTCVAIASKFFSNCSNVTNDMAINFLSSSGHKYTFETLLKSEIRVLKTLKFNIASLPLVLPYVCALLDCSCEKIKCFARNEIYDFCVNLLICFYACSDKIYERYLRDVVKNVSSDIDLNNQIAVLSKDMILLSCGVIASASYIWSKKGSDHVIKVLSEIAQLSQNIIVKFSCIILEESLW